MIPEVVDGETILIPDAVAWQALRRTPEIDGRPLGEAVLRLMWGQWEYVQSHPELRLGFYRAGRWLLPVVLLRMGERWQRVHLEWPRCPACGWRGATATPLLPELYLGTGNERALLQAASRIPVVGCPRCGAALPGDRHPIWAEAPVSPTEPPAV